MKRLIAVLTLFTQLTCAPDGSVSVEILFVQRPAETDCSYSAESTKADLVGKYDPTGSDGMFLGISMQSNLADPNDDKIACPGGQTECNGLCEDLQSDDKNCGACANVCKTGEVCSNGQCTLNCATGETNCSGSCADLQTSSTHCGACGVPFTKSTTLCDCISF